MDAIFNSVIQNLAVIGAAIAFLFSILKWQYQRDRDRELVEHEAFHKMVRLASGAGEEHGRWVQQIAAIHQLKMYRKYSFASIPVLKLMLVDYAESDNPYAKYFVDAINETINYLET